MYTYRYAFRELTRHKARTSINILGYAVAVAFMVAMMSIGQSHFLAAVGVLKATGTHFIAFVPQSESCCAGLAEKGGPYAEGAYTSLIDEGDFRAIKNLRGVRDAAPYLLFKMHHDEYGSFFAIGGIDPTSLATSTNVCSPANILQGRSLIAGDEDVVILEESFARVSNLNVNDFINAFGREFRIVGIVNCGIKPAKADMYAPIEVVREIVKQHGKYLDDVDMNIVLVEVADARVQDDVIESVQKVLAERVGRAVTSTYACYIPARDVISLIEKAAWALSLIIVISVILFAFKSQLASVVERTRDIGILKSLGWTNSNVMGQILMESIIQALIGGAVGCGMAILVVFLLRWSNLTSGGNIILGISYPAIAAGITLALIGGVLAGIFPAWRASKLQPAEALRRFGGQ